MKSNKIKLAVAAIALTTIAGLFAGCGNSASANNTASNSTAAVSGSITAAGSTALQPLVQQSAADFKTKNPNATINVQGGGSGTGLTQVSQGSVDIGDSDIFAKAKLNAADVAKVEDHQVCVIGFAVVTSKDVKVTNLTKQQVQDIFTGKITNWKDVGGQDLKINVVHRPSSSGTRATFADTFLPTGVAENDSIGTTQDSSGAVKDAMLSTGGSISYLAMSYLTADVTKDINAVQIDGVAATNANIEDGKYPFWSYEHMYTKGPATGLAKAFINYIMSSDNKAVVQKLGYIPSSDMKVTK